MAAPTVSASAKVVSFRLGDVQGAAQEELRARMNGDVQLKGKIVSFAEDAATGQRLAVVEVPGIRTPVLVPMPNER